MTAAEPTPLSLERVQALFDQQGWNYDLQPERQSLRTGFSGIGMEIKYLAPTITVVTTVAVDVITAERFDEVLAWVERYNNEHTFPTAAALQDEERNLTALGATYSLPGQWDYTDEQFAAHISSAIEGIVNASRDFLGDFAPEVLTQIDAQLG